MQREMSLWEDIVVFVIATAILHVTKQGFNYFDYGTFIFIVVSVCKYNLFGIVNMNI